LIVQVGAVKQTDSSGLGELTVVYTLATAKRCPVRLVAANNDMRKILVVTRLDRVLPVSDDLETAKDEIRKSATKQASSPG
jgi:anti-anti-sigma factor